MSSPEPDTISSRVSWMWATIAFCIALFGVYYADQAESQRFQQEIRSETLEQLSRLRADIESRLTGDLQLFTGDGKTFYDIELVQYFLERILFEQLLLLHFKSFPSRLCSDESARRRRLARCASR